jgi:hypothetical protein
LAHSDETNNNARYPAMVAASGKTEIWVVAPACRIKRLAHKILMSPPLNSTHMITANDSSFVTIAYRADVNMLVTRWLCKVGMEQICAGYTAALETAVQHRCARWLVDTRRRAGTDLDGAEWMFSTFFPAVQLRLLCPVYMAFLVAPPLMRNDLPNALLPIAEDFGDVHGQRFTDECQAVKWLLQY